MRLESWAFHFQLHAHCTCKEYRAKWHSAQYQIWTQSSRLVRRPDDVLPKKNSWLNRERFLPLNSSEICVLRTNNMLQIYRVEGNAIVPKNSIYYYKAIRPLLSWVKDECLDLVVIECTLQNKRTSARKDITEVTTSSYDRSHWVSKFEVFYARNLIMNSTWGNGV